MIAMLDAAPVRWIAMGLAVLTGSPAAETPAAADGDAERAIDPARRFRDLAQRVAARTGSRVIAWGEARLADDERPRRFAVLEPDDLRVGRGAYLIEDRPGQLWRVSYRVDGRTLPWGPEPGASTDSDPAWQIRTDRAVEHGQSHHKGGETVAFALRQGTLRVLVHEVTGDVEPDATRPARFGCVAPCPPLDGHLTEDADLRVVGPASTVEALTR